jgi:hypothetical protein
VDIGLAAAGPHGEEAGIRAAAALLVLEELAAADDAGHGRVLLAAQRVVGARADAKRRRRLGRLRSRSGVDAGGGGAEKQS